MAIWRECRERYGEPGANGDGPFLYGGPSIADAMFAPVVTRFLTYAVPLDETCRAYVDAVMAWPPMAEWCREARSEKWTLFYPVLDMPIA
jgi:glutathione S-transferase